jgi:hypothetical protein
MRSELIRERVSIPSATTNPCRGAPEIPELARWVHRAH